jgi:signal transduction histidine kinase
MHWRIRSQLLVPLLILLLGVVGISTWTAISSAKYARHSLETRMRDIAETVARVNIRNVPNVLDLMHGMSEAEFLWKQSTGEFLASVNLQAWAKRRGKWELEHFPGPAEHWSSLRMGPPVRIDDQMYLCSGVRLGEEGESGVLYILYPESLWHDALWAAVRPSLILGVFGGVASLVLTIGVAHRLSGRVRELERRTRLIAAGDFSPMPLPGGNDEIRDLAHSVNEMAERLAQLQETLRQTERLRLLGQVSGGLAHQLRNGVTGAKLAVQLHAGDCAGKIDTEALDVALRQLALVEANLKRFLDVGRTDLRQREPCSLHRLVEDAVGLLQPQCRHARIDLSWEPPHEDCITIGDRDQLGQLLLNVLGNAVEAAGPGGRVRVTMTSTPQSAKIDVRDNGPGPPPTVAQRLFEPFVTGKPDGVGLGLAAARQAAIAHGGQISWGREDGWTCFVIELPVQAGRSVARQEPQAVIQR